MNDMKARGYKVTERILNICINYANGPTKYSGAISAERLKY